VNGLAGLYTSTSNVMTVVLSINQEDGFAVVNFDAEYHMAYANEGEPCFVETVKVCVCVCVSVCVCVCVCVRTSVLNLTRV
jgi:hypothetical protein